MHWTAREDHTLALTAATPAARQAALEALIRLRDCGPEQAAETGSQLIKGLRSGSLHAQMLVELGHLCHRHDDSREAARFASERLFDFVLPTPTAGLASETFWRVARRLEQDGGPPSPTEASARALRYKTFAERPEACAYGSELGDRLVSITESQGEDGTTTTLWFWTEASAG